MKKGLWSILVGLLCLSILFAFFPDRSIRPLMHTGIEQGHSNEKTNGSVCTNRFCMSDFVPSSDIILQVNESISLAFWVCPEIRATNASVEILLPPLLQYVYGSLMWKGDFNPGEVIRLGFSVRPIDEFKEYIEARVKACIDGYPVEESRYMSIGTPNASNIAISLKVDCDNQEYGTTTSTSILASGGYVTVKGKFAYSTGLLSSSPMRQIKVTLYDYDPSNPYRFLDETTASDDGGFSFYVKNNDPADGGGLDVFLVAWAENVAARCTDAGGALYGLKTDTRSNVQDGTIVDYGTQKPGSNNDAWVAIDAVLSEYRWISDKTKASSLFNYNSWTRSQVLIKYPYEDWPHSHGDEIHLRKKSIWDPITGGGWDIATVYHEYAHCVMYTAYSNHWPPIQTSIDKHYVYSETDGGFALCEGWAEFMSCAVPNDPGSLWDISFLPPDYGNIESNDWYNWNDKGDLDGNRVEGSVASVLWDIFDPINDDNLNMGFDEIFSIFVKDNRPDDIVDFWGHWHRTWDDTAVSYGYRNAMAAIFNMYGVYVEETAPNVSVSCSPTNPTDADTVSIRVAASDGGTALHFVIVYWYDGVWHSKEWDLLRKGTFSDYVSLGRFGMQTIDFYAIAYDHAGNSKNDPASGSKSVTVVDDDTNEPSYSSQTSSPSGTVYDSYSANIRLQIDWDDSSLPFYEVKFRYRYGSGSMSSWLSPTGSGGRTYWYDISASEWVTHLDTTIAWESYAIDGDNDRSGDSLKTNTPTFTGPTLRDDDTADPSFSNPTYTGDIYDDYSGSYRIGITVTDSSDISVVNFRYRFDGSWSSWYSRSGLSGNQYWYDIPKSEWSQHVPSTIYFQVYAEDNDNDRSNDRASATSSEYTAGNILKRGNNAPSAVIDSISPNPAVQGDTVYFSGHGSDPDGDSIVEYGWRSSIDGSLSSSSSFSTSSLSVGTHTIYFKVKDSRGAWSTEATRTLTINPKEAQEVKFRGLVRDRSPPIIGAVWWNVEIQEVLFDPSSALTVGTIMRVGAVIAPPLGMWDDAQIGDSVEVFGSYQDTEISLNGENYYLRVISSALTCSVYPGRSDGIYYIGERITIYFSASQACDGEMTVYYPDGSIGQDQYSGLLPNQQYSTGGTASYPVGRRYVVFEVWQGSQTATATCEYFVYEGVTYSVHLESRQNSSSTVTNLGRINDHSLPADISVAAGSYSISYTAASGYVFDRWEVSGTGISVANVNLRMTTVTVSSSGSSRTLRAVYKALPPVTYSVRLESREDSSSTVTNLGSIVFGGTGHSLTASVSVAAGSYSISYTAASGYVFDRWEVSGTGISVGSPYSRETTVTVSSSGSSRTLRAVYKALPRPDLTIANIDLAPSSPKEGETVTFSVNIKNQGTEGAGLFKTAYYIDGTKLGEWTIPSLSVGQTSIQTFTWPATYGTHTVKAFADSSNSIQEKDENNNPVEKSFTVAGKPDLMVSSIDVSPTSVIEGQTVTFNVSVKNQGTVNAGGFTVAYYIDGNKLADWSVSSLYVGKTVSKAFTWSAIEGTHSVKVVADYKLNVDEKVETNNEATRTVQVGPKPKPDLLVSSLVFSPDHPVESDTVNFTIAVKNDGTLRSGSFKTTYYVNKTKLGEFSVTSLEIGQSISKTFPWPAVKGNHTFDVFVDSGFSVSERNETNNLKSQSLLVPGRPDLVISDIVSSPSVLKEGESVNFTVSIKNQGNEDSGPFRIAYSIDGTNLGELSLSSLSGGQNTSVIFIWTATFRSRLVRVVVDPGNAIREKDENNNMKEKAFTVAGKPELIVSNISWAPSSTVEDDKITFTVTIKNQGNASAGSFKATYYVDDLIQGEWSLYSLSNGQTINKTFTWTATAGNHTVKAYADPANTIDESNEMNNWLKTPIFETALRPKPDLIVDDIFWSPSSPVEGDTINLTVIIKNNGTLKSGSFNAAYYINETKKGEWIIPGLLVDQSISRTFSWTGVKGNHVVDVFVDSGLRVAERNESNNRNPKSIVVLGKPDLVVANVSWVPSSPKEGETVNFTVYIKNQGNGDADGFRVDYYIDGSKLGELSVPGLLSGQNTTVAFNWTAVYRTHVVRVVVDSGFEVQEKAENNNLWEKPVSVAGKPDLTISKISYSPASPVQGLAVVFTVTIRNNGNASASSFNVTYYVDDQKAGEWSISSLGARQYTTKTYRWVATEAGNHTFSAAADLNNNVDEADETNNEQAAAFSCSAKANIANVAFIAKAFGTESADADWSPAADLNDDGKTNILDMTIIAKKFETTV